MRLISATSLSTAEVRSPAGENVGKIVDFMLDTGQRRVRYAVLSVGGVLGVGAKMLALPPQAMALDGNGRCVNLSLETAALDEAAGIDRANPPATANAVLSISAQQTPPSFAAER